MNNKVKYVILMRHSIPAKDNKISNNLIPLTEDGILKARKLLDYNILNDVKAVYSSSYKRALDTAKIFSKDVIVDDRLIERKIGDVSNLDNDFWQKQYIDYNYKNAYGESFNDVKNRMRTCINEVLNKLDEEDKVLIVTHAAAICAYLTDFCRIKVLNKEEKIREIRFNNKIVLSGKIDTPSLFVLEFVDNKIQNITYKECN